MAGFFVVASSCGQSSSTVPVQPVANSVPESPGSGDVAVGNEPVPEPVDISQFPETALDQGRCSTTSSVVAAGEHAMAEVSDEAAGSVSDVADGMFDLVAIGRVADRRTPIEVSLDPLDQTVRESGLSAEAFVVDVTPISIEIESVLVGEPVNNMVNTFEIGCLAVGATPSTTVGQQLLVFADRSPEDAGYDIVTGSNYRLRDWMSFEDGVTTERIGVTGTYALIPDLLGLTDTELTEAFTDP